MDGMAEPTGNTALKLITPKNDYVTIDYTDRQEDTESERRTKYNTLLKPKFKEVLQMIAEGHNDYSIAEKIGVHYNTLSRWKKEYKEFGDLYVRAQDARNCLTMNSAFKRANGITVQLKKQKVLSDGTIKDYVEEQYFPPDVNAIDLYERNNNPDYKSAKADTGNLTLIQNNFQLPELKQQLQQIEQELKKLETPMAVDVEVIDDR